MLHFIFAAAAVLTALYPLSVGVSYADVEPAPYVASETRTVWVTAYSSTPEETDDTPFITASGSQVRDGIVATNLFPMGTQLMIPEHFGDRVFVVEDRMHSRKKNNVDVWMSSKEQAIAFGASYTDIVVLKDAEDEPVALAGGEHLAAR